MATGERPRPQRELLAVALSEAELGRALSREWIVEARAALAGGDDDEATALRAELAEESAAVASHAADLGRLRALHKALLGDVARGRAAVCALLAVLPPCNATTQREPSCENPATRTDRCFRWCDRHAQALRPRSTSMQDLRWASALRELVAIVATWPASEAA